MNLSFYRYDGTPDERLPGTRLKSVGRYEAPRRFNVEMDYGGNLTEDCGIVEE